MVTRVAAGAILVLSVVVGGPALRGREERQVTGLHDVSTDTRTPPAFVAVLPHRRWALNPPEYDGAAAAALQAEQHPDLAPLVVARPKPQVYAAARTLVGRRGWRLVGDDEDAGLLEAIATTRWLRFRDDVAVRVTETATGTRVDMRSKSRLGNADFGTNARRIREFLADLSAMLGSGLARDGFGVRSRN